MEMERKSGLSKNKPYLFLISSQIVSSLGDWLDMLALMALVALKWDATPLEMTGVGICMVAPMVLIGPISGILADKFERKTLMIISDVLRCIIVLSFVFTTAIWQLYLLLILKSIFGSLFVPSKNGKLKEIVPEENMQAAMAISGMIDSGSKIIGPMISGLLVSLIGIQWAFYLDAGTFILSALLLIGVPRRVRNENSVETDSKQISFVKELKEGFDFFKKLPVLLFGLIVLSVSILVLQLADTQLMILLREVEGIDPVDIAGYAIAANGLGMFVMSLILSKKKINSTFIYMAIGSAGLGFTFIAGALSIQLPVLLLTILFPLIFLISGFAVDAIMIPFQVDVQKNTPVEYTGRVFGTINSLTTLASLLGMVIGGILAEALGVVSAYIVSGSLLVVVGIVVYIMRFRLEGRDFNAESKRRLQGETPL
ncbi:MFS transporter [Fredinandcohnia sp. 179-A 10B2 NHS]|uniref:MFS transporter n=1 Tax=Fredinandcohnia sp. 179-A 10B2 NHS TaxID=3235176 RepID=UPI0039A03FC3